MNQRVLKTSTGHVKVNTKEEVSVINAEIKYVLNGHYYILSINLL